MATETNTISEVLIANPTITDAMHVVAATFDVHPNRVRKELLARPELLERVNIEADYFARADSISDSPAYAYGLLIGTMQAAMVLAPPF